MKANFRHYMTGGLLDGEAIELDIDFDDNGGVWVNGWFDPDADPPLWMPVDMLNDATILDVVKHAEAQWIADAWRRE